MGGRQILGRKETSDRQECDGWLGGFGALEEVSLYVHLTVVVLIFY
jgi:hypothetical protein